MDKRRSRRRQPSMWVASSDLPRSAGHLFYERLNRVLDETGTPCIRPLARRLASCVVLTLALAASAAAQPARSSLNIYWIDVEGGAATLIVTPAGQSILMDAGWNREDARDAMRIEAALRDAGIDHLDFFIASHFHGDHVGGLAALAERVPIGQFIDHGDSVDQSSERGRATWEAYVSVAGDRRRTVRPGDKLPLRGLEFSFVAAHGETLAQPLMPLGPNPHCGGSWPSPDESGENPRSVGYLVSLGAFQLLDLGDATVGVQLALACPVNKLANVDIYQVPHHGNGVAPQLTWALEPTVAVINNGPHKGGSAEGFQVVADSPRLEDIWQSHRPLDTALPYRTTDELTANLTDEDVCRGHWIKATINPDGRSYSITNRRNGVSRAYISR